MVCHEYGMYPESESGDEGWSFITIVQRELTRGVAVSLSWSRARRARPIKRYSEISARIWPISGERVLFVQEIVS